jgi:uncharacterized protein (TIGR01244 family)
MLSGKSLQKRLLRALFFILVISSYSGAQEPAKRVPGKMLPPQFSGILLMDSREQQEQPERVLQVMGLRDGDVVADIGCGNGFYSLRLARQIGPRGVVFAVDVQQGMLDQLAERQEEAGISNIYPVLGRYEDPLLPPGKVDWMLVADAYHEFSNPEAMLARMKEALAPGGRVALIEYRAERETGANGFPVPRDHSMTVDEVVSEWSRAGFELVNFFEFLPIQHFFVFRNADDTSRPAIRRLTVENASNVSTYDNKVYFAGQPGEDALKRFGELGVKTVVNLRTDQEMSSLGFDEREAAGNAGMKYLHVPMGFELPDASNIQKVMDALDAAGDAPVLLHCGSAARSGAVWALYEGLHGGIPADEAIAEGREAGMNGPALEKAVREALSKP